MGERKLKKIQLLKKFKFLKLKKSVTGENILNAPRPDNREGRYMLKKSKVEEISLDILSSKSGCRDICWSASASVYKILSNTNLRECYQNKAR
jgi:hypothetical protein